MYILNKNQQFNGYAVAFPLSQGTYAESYRVKSAEGKSYFLKLINYSKLHHTQFDEVGNVLELSISKQIKHPNLATYHDSGDTMIQGQRFVYIIYDYISGETAAQQTVREQMCSVYDAKNIVSGVLNGLKYLHNQAVPIIHNELTIQNIMLDLSSSIPIAKIIDFGYARYSNQRIGSFQREGLNPFYLAPESLNGVFTIQTDIYAVGAMLYHLLFGLPPYFIELSKYESDRSNIVEAITIERSKPIKFLNRDLFEFDDQLANVIAKALCSNVDNRFKTAEEFISALNGDVNIEAIAPIVRNSETIPNEKSKNIRKGNGFADIAGMQVLKDQLRFEVIDLLENPEEYKRHGLDLPNGILLYGPPGCGKTFFAEKFAEEVGFNFYQIKPSDIQSKWINASQENVRQLFDEAEKQAPSIIFIDEIDALVPSRDTDGVSHMNSSVVNEFLAQMNNAGERGLFIIGATNRPNSIDPAIMRSGRLEQKYYISTPDEEARKAMFELYLKNRPVDFGLDYGEMARLTDNYVSSDIKLLIDKASRITIKEKLRVITQELMVRIIKTTQPTISLEEIKKHEAVHNKLTGNNQTKPERKRVGF